VASLNTPPADTKPKDVTRFTVDTKLKSGLYTSASSGHNHANHSGFSYHLLFFQSPTLAGILQPPRLQRVFAVLRVQFRGHTQNNRSMH